MSELWTQGLIVSAVGLVVTFAALGLLIGLMVLLVRLFPTKMPAAETAVPPVAQTTHPSEPDKAALVAAIAAALALAQRTQNQQLGHGLEADHSPWWYKDKARDRG